MADIKPKHVVQRYVSEFLNGEIAGPADTWIADEALRRRATAFRDAFPDLLVTPLHLVAEGDLVALHAIGRGTHRRVFQGCPPTDRQWSATCTAIYRVGDGRIAEAWVNWDVLSILEQLGAVTRAPTVSA
jgi:predicted ester cyclase